MMVMSIKKYRFVHGNVRPSKGFVRNTYLKNKVVWRDARVVEEARLESVYTPKAYRGFESRSLRQTKMDY